jgi:hypothetical protein
MTLRDAVEIGLTLYGILPGVGHFLSKLPSAKLQRLGAFLEAFGADLKKAREAVTGSAE